jgi:hypothetical protein
MQRPTARTWIKHLLLLALTFCTATIAGTLYPFGPYSPFGSSDTLGVADPQTLPQFLQFIFALPTIYGALIVDAIRQLVISPARATASMYVV